MKYGLIFSSEQSVQNVNNVLDQKVYSTGCLNWSRVFNGKAYRASRINPNDFDVIHVQLTNDTLYDVIRLREKITNNKTKLVVNPDYSLHYWHHFGNIPDLSFKCLEVADYVFGQCYQTATFLSEVLQKDVPMIPHPLDTKWLKNHAIPAHKRDGRDVVTNIHRDMQYYTPWFILRNRPDIVKHLVGFQDPSSGGTKHVAHQMYDHLYRHIPNPDLIDRVWRNAFCVIDHYTHAVQGRSTMQVAALGIPCLGWSNVDAQSACYPHTTSEQGDVAHQIQIFEKLQEDEDFVATVSATAMEAAEIHYSFDACKLAFEDMVNDTDITSAKAAD